MIVQFVAEAVSAGVVVPAEGRGMVCPVAPAGAQVLVDESWPGGAEFASGGDPFTNGQVHPYLEHRQFHR